MSALPSTLDSVTVYREGAICRRLAKLTAGPDRQLRFGGLPLSLEAGSLRARVQTGSGRVVDVRPQFDVELAEEVDVPAEQRAWEDAGARLAQLELVRQRLNAEIGELQSLRPSFLEHKKGEPPRPAPVESMLALGDFTEGELTTRLEKRRALDQEIQDAQQEQMLRQRRMQEASTAKRAERARLSRVAVVTLAEAPAAPFELELEYRVPGARWVPSYSLTLEKGLANGALQMRASVAQNTGEDWRDVRLSLSTASSSRRADMPELKALKIGRRQEAPPRSGWREPPPGLEALFEAYDLAMSGMPPRPVAPPASVPPPQSRPKPMPPKDMVSREQSKTTGNYPAAPPPPPPAPGMAMAASVVSFGASAPMPSAAPMAPPRGGARAAMAPMQALAKGGGALGGMMRKRSMDREEALAEMAPEMDEDGEGGFLGDDLDLGATAEQAGLAAGFGDYARLAMAAPESRGSRGRLTNASEWDFAFVAGISVQIDVVMAIVGRAQRTAAEVQGLTLPALCNPVSSVKSFDYRYDCGARLDVPSTGKWVLVPVMSCAVGLTPEYVCVPSVEQKVYRTLTIANRSTHALLPGPVDVTAGDEFLMTTSLPAIGPGADQSHRLGLGVEESIKVARKTQYKETTGGFLGGSTVLPHDVEIELNNRLAAPALIEVRERVPTVDANEKDLKVEEVGSTPPWEKVEGPVDGAIVKGARRWRVTVPGGQSQKLTAQFAIRMPADKMLVGGNRRN